MKEAELNKLIQDKNLLANRLHNYEEMRIIQISALNPGEIQGHLEKAQHNLMFVNDIKKSKYLDWAITGCYYSVYHAALALLLAKGCLSKNHDATICLLIRDYYRQGIEQEDIELLNRFFLDYEDLTFYVQSKNKREEATYSSKLRFDASLLEELRIKAVLFVEKAKAIVENEMT